MLTPVLSESEDTLLDIKDSARRRVVCGLRWDPLDEAQDHPSGDSPRASTQGIRTAHDLDLLCLVFDNKGNMLEGITGEEGHRMGDSGNIYHTGDVVDGADMLDDEQISLELFNISQKVHQIFFIAEVQSAHTFGQILNPEIRIANAIDDVNFAHTDLGGSVGADLNAFVFGCIYRHPEGWMFRKIYSYCDGNDIRDWGTALKGYLITDEAAQERQNEIPTPKKGETVPLFYSKKARQRVLCGLNWDPHPEQETDLDLACVIYNAAGEAVDGVSARPDENVDSSGKIYHSGDHTSGEGERTDDEAISVELRDLPDYIDSIIFMAEIQSGQPLSHVMNPSMRIADGKTNEDQLLIPLTSSDAENVNACVFAKISRRQDGWQLTAIEDYFSGADVEDLISYLQRYLG